MDDLVLGRFRSDMRKRGFTAATIEARLTLVGRLAAWLDPTPLLAATGDQLEEWQRQFGGLAPATRNIYVRHVQAIYRWAHQCNLIETDPSTALIVPTVRRGLPHPTPPDTLRTIFACTTGALRVTYVLACFAGTRCAEVAHLEVGDLDLSDIATARLHGKGGKERIVPLLPPVVDELRVYGLPRAGAVIRRGNGEPYTPKQLSLDSHFHLRRLGVDTTLHSMRHAFATAAYRTTQDLLLVADLLGHSSVQTTQIYAAADRHNAAARLAGVTDLARSVLGPRSQILHAVN